MKFRGHETFYLRKGWVNKGLKNLIIAPDIFSQKSAVAMDTLGIGSNMIKSLRYWLKVFDLIYKQNAQRRDVLLTRAGELIQQNDPYLEEIGTLLYMQYQLASNNTDATSWYYFFNKFPLKEFTKEDFMHHINNYILLKNEQVVAERSLSDDWNCLLNTYSLRHGKADEFYAENNIESPLQELQLITCIDTKKKLYAKTSFNYQDFPLEIAMYIITKRFYDNDEVTEIRLDEFLNADKSIPSIFNFDFINSVSLLEQLDKFGYIKFVKTAGLDVIKLTNPQPSIHYLEEYYNNL